jgi:hypothetical protein
MSGFHPPFRETDSLARFAKEEGTEASAPFQLGVRPVLDASGKPAFDASGNQKFCARDNEELLKKYIGIGERGGAMLAAAASTRGMLSLAARKAEDSAAGSPEVA